MDAILLDFSKAFDKVSHQLLAIKLDHYGIRGNLLQWIKSFLANRTQQVLVEGHTSSPAPITSGVSQGTVLGPLLFLPTSWTCRFKYPQLHVFLPMTVSCIRKQRAKKMLGSLRKTSTNCKSGRGIGKCRSTPVNMRS